MTAKAQAHYRSKILGVGSYVPPRVVTNDDLAGIMETSNDWIVQRTGIRQRHWVDGATSTSDLALQAVERALASAGVDKGEIELIVLATLSPDHDFPGTGCFLQAKLGVPGIPALDIRQQCTGFIYGMSIADQFVRSGMYRKVLVVGAEVHSKGLDRTTQGRDVAVLFGDGAGAVVIGRADEGDQGAILSTHLHADGRQAKELWLEAPGMAFDGPRMSTNLLDAGAHFPKMNGKTVFVNAVKRMPESVAEALEANGMTIDQVDLFLFHQANMRINEMVAKQLGIPENKVFNTIERFGNTTAATLPLGMDEAVKAGVLKRGMTVVMAAFGSGFTWGSAIFRY